MRPNTQNDKCALRNLKTWICSGETLAISLAEEFFKRFPESDHQLCNFYGSTEIMGDVTYYIITGPQQLRHQTKVPIGTNQPRTIFFGFYYCLFSGHPVDNTIIYLLDNEFRPVKAGDVGELFVSGANLAMAYVNRRDPEKFVENPLAIDPAFSKLYRTGDFAKLEKGVIVYEGRTDSQIKIRGHRVDLSEIEKALLGLQDLEKAVVLCYKPGELNQTLLAFVTVRKAISESEIESALLAKLPAYMVPQVVLVEDLPLLINGKIDRQTLLKNYENNNNNEGRVVQL